MQCVGRAECILYPPISPNLLPPSVLPSTSLFSSVAFQSQRQTREFGGSVTRLVGRLVVCERRSISVAGDRGHSHRSIVPAAAVVADSYARSQLPIDSRWLY
ncbi:hypothetical protein CHUAL_001241 [Chamberlinius hualienensis]